MSIGKVVVLAIAHVFVSGGVGAALADWNSPAPGPAIDLVDVDARKDDGVDDTALVDDEDDAGGNDGPGQVGAQNVAPQAAAAGDGDATAGNDGTAGGDNTQASPAPAPAPVVLGDGDVTAGNDGTAGGDNTQPGGIADAGAGAAAAADTDDAAEGGAGGAAGGTTEDSGGDTG